MKLKNWEEEVSFSLKKILWVKMLEALENCWNGYEKNQSNDFDET